MSEIDFSRRQRFPGEVGNTFDVILRAAERINQIPGVLFAGMLVVLAILVSAARWAVAVPLTAFFLLDWLLIALLPVARRSYGPSQPPMVILAVLRSVFILLPLPFPFNWGLQAVGTLLVIYAFWVEPHTIRVTRQQFVSDKLHSSRPLRVLHLGDLHIERITGRERQLNRLVADLNPDLILFSGDILNLSYIRDTQAIAAAREVISTWSAPLGVYGVSGSPAVDLVDVFPGVIAGLPLQRLDNQKITLQHDGDRINLIGLTCTHRPHLDGPQLTALLPAQPVDFTVLLYHTPDLAPAAAAAGVDLQLSGHTHGGQVRLPLFGALVTGSLYGKRFEAGRMLLERMTLYITRGIGMEGAGAPRVRFLCPPEIILWEIKSSHSSS